MIVVPTNGKTRAATSMPTVPDIKSALTKLGLSTDGLKHVLLKRLTDAQAQLRDGVPVVSAVHQIDDVNVPVVVASPVPVAQPVGSAAAPVPGANHLPPYWLGQPVGPAFSPPPAAEQQPPPPAAKSTPMQEVMGSPPAQSVHADGFEELTGSARKRASSAIAKSAQRKKKKEAWEKDSTHPNHNVNFKLGEWKFAKTVEFGYLDE